MMKEEGQRNHRKIRMEMELQSVSKNQHQFQSNVNEISRVEDEKDFHLDAAFHPHVDLGALPTFLHDQNRRYRRTDLSYNFILIYFTAWIKMSPVGVAETSKKCPRFRVGHKTWWKNMISLGWFLLAFLRLGGLVVSTIHFVLTQEAGKELGKMTLMICLSASGSILMQALISVMFHTIPHAVPLINSTLKYLDQEPKSSAEEETKNRKSTDAGDDDDDGRRRFGLRMLKFHTPKELLIIHLPILVCSILGVFPLMSIVDPSFPLLLVALLPPELWFSPVFFSVVLLDSILVSYFIMIIHMVFYLFFGMHRITEEAQLTTKNMNKNREWKNQNGSVDLDSASNSNSESGSELELEMKKISRALKSLRLLHIWTKYYNLSFSTTVYSCKLIAMSASILGGFGVIKMIEQESWPYAAVFALMFLEGIILYDLSFGGAYEIPEKVEELKREIREMSHRMNRLNRNPKPRPYQNRKGTRAEIKYMEKVLISVPWLGVKDGVYKMERMTCVNFLEFVIQQVTSLVLAD